MAENMRYEVRGTTALAAPRRGGEENLIDYDIARRSYEARQRLAARQAHAREAGNLVSRGKTGGHSSSRPTMQEVVWETATPGRMASSSLRETAQGARVALLTNPIWLDLLEGTARGQATGKATYRQVLHATTIGLAMCAAIVFLGA